MTFLRLAGLVSELKIPLAASGRGTAFPVLVRIGLCNDGAGGNTASSGLLMVVSFSAIVAICSADADEDGAEAVACSLDIACDEVIRRSLFPTLSIEDMDVCPVLTI